jgi:hypothetical protein
MDLPVLLSNVKESGKLSGVRLLQTICQAFNFILAIEGTSNWVFFCGYYYSFITLGSPVAAQATHKTLF